MTRHPAKFTDVLLPVMANAVIHHSVPGQGFLILDPFAGTGKIFEFEKLIPNCVCWANELEPEWAAKHPRSIIGNALKIMFEDNLFDVICTSPCYGNRMADHHEAKDSSRRNTYRHALGRPLSSGSAAGMQWGDEYRSFHASAWKEATRVLRHRGLFVLNISDHIRGGEQQYVSDWHAQTLESLGYRCLDDILVETPRQRFGANGGLRVEYEHVYIFRNQLEAEQ